jgi:hypothetical protein
VDVKYQGIQDLLMAGMTPLVHLATSLANAQQADTKVDTTACLNQLMESLFLLTAANGQINNRRKDNLRSDLSPTYTSLCTYSRDTAKDLFGEDVSKVMKDLRDTTLSPKGGAFRGGHHYNSHPRKPFLGQAPRQQQYGQRPGPYRNNTGKRGGYQSYSRGRARGHNQGSKRGH